MMTKLKQIRTNKKMSQAKLATLSDVNVRMIQHYEQGSKDINAAAAITVYKLAKALNVPVEELLEPVAEERISFELFKSNICHKLKELGDIEFLIHYLENDYVTKYYKQKWHAECLYVLAMIDYISRLNNIELCTKYETLRKVKLPEIVYPTGVLAICLVEQSDRMKQKSIQDSIPEFIRHNIVEAEVRNVV